MTTKEAKKIGQSYTLVATVAGVFIAIFMMLGMIYEAKKSLIIAFKSFFELLALYPLNFSVALLALVAYAIYWGQKAGISILINRKNSLLIGSIELFQVLMCSTFTASLVGFFQEGLSEFLTNNNLIYNHNPIYRYIGIPIILVLVFGCIPTLLLGLWMGVQIQKAGNKKSVA